MSEPGGTGSAEWERVAERWAHGRRLLWESTRPVSMWLVERLAPAAGEAILELAAGTGETGFLAAAALGPDGRLISSDRSPAMVDAARRLSAELGLTNVEFRVLDAERIELPSLSVDGVLSRFGYVLRGEPPAALSEIRRVLRADGRFAFAVWAERQLNSWMTVPAGVMIERGHCPPPSAEQLRLSQRRNPAAIDELLARAAFRIREIEEMPVSYRFADSDELWRFVSELRGPLSLALDGLDGVERAAVRSEIEARTTRTEGGGFELGGVSINVVAE